MNDHMKFLGYMSGNTLNITHDCLMEDYHSHTNRWHHMHGVGDTGNPKRAKLTCIEWVMTDLAELEAEDVPTD